MELIEELLERFYEFGKIKTIFEGIPHVLKTQNHQHFSSFKAKILSEAREQRVETKRENSLFLKVEKEWSPFFIIYSLRF